MRRAFGFFRGISVVCFVFLVAEVLSAPPPEGLEATFRLGSSTARPGGDVRLPIYVSSSEPLAGLSISVDFDEEVLEATKIDLVYQRPDGAGWFPQFIFLDINRNGRSNINNSNETPGNAGVDEGYLYGAVVFEPEETLKEYIQNGGKLEDLLPPVDVETEILAIHFKVKPDAPLGETQIRFLDDAPSVNPAVTVQNVAALMPGYTAELKTDIGAVGISGNIGILGGASLFFRGDSNGDKELDVTDVIFTLDYLFRGLAEPPCLDAADANDDGFLDVSDPIATLSALFLDGGKPLPPPTETPDTDPTPDDGLSCLTGI